MAEKNPYEKQDDIDLIDFLNEESEKEKEDIDMSTFRFDSDDENDEEEYEEYSQPTYLKVKKPVVITVAVLLAVLLAMAVIGLVYGFSQHRSYVSENEAFKTAENTWNIEKLQLNNRITALEQEINELKNSGGQKPSSDSQKYKVIIESLNMRETAEISEGNEVLQLDEGDVVTVVDNTVVEDGIRKWLLVRYVGGEFDCQGYICISAGSDNYVEAVD